MPDPVFIDDPENEDWIKQIGLSDTDEAITAELQKRRKKAAPKPNRALVEDDVLHSLRDFLEPGYLVDGEGENDDSD